MTGPGRATRALVRLAAIRANVQAVRRALAPSTRLWAVVKANGYGHGAVPVATTVLEAGADALAVALPEEGWELRRAGVESRILVLGPLLPEQAVSVVAADLDAIVFTPAVIEALARAAVDLGRPVRVHLKVDTGMGRVGARPDEAAALAECIVAEPSLRWAGLMTHLADADHDDREWTRGQYRQLVRVVDDLRRRGW